MDHAIISKGVPRPLPGFVRSPDLYKRCCSTEGRYATQGFALSIRYLHGVMHYTKGVSHLLNPFVHFFCCAQKKWTKEKGTAARSLSRQNFRALLRNDCESLRLFGVRLRRTSEWLSSLIHSFLKQ